MKVILQKDVRDLGKAGELVNVKNGFARNFLFPRNLALEATETRVKEFEHLQRVAEAKRRKAVAERKEVVGKLQGVNVVFQATAGDTDKLFGSITTKDISDKLDAMGFSIDKKDIQLPEPIRMLGQHKATVDLGDDLKAEIVVTVERA